MLAGSDVHPYFGVFADDAVDRRHDFRILQIQFGLLDRGLSLLHGGVGGNRARFGGGHLFRAGLRVLQIGLGLSQLALRLGHLLGRGGGGGMRGRHGSAARFGRGDRLIELLLGYFLLVDQLLVSNQIVLRFDVVGLRLGHLGLGGFQLVFGNGDSGAGIFHVRFGNRDLAGGIDRGNRNVDVQSLSAGFGIGQLRFGLIQRNLIILRIDFGEHRSGFHFLVVVHVDANHITGNARAERHQVSIHLGVVGRFVGLEIFVGEKTADEQYQHNYDRDDFRVRPARQGIAGTRGGRLRGGMSFLRDRTVLRGLYRSFHFSRLSHGLFSFEVFAHALFTQAQRTGQRDLRVVKTV